MKRFSILLAAGIAASVLLAACGTVPKQTPAQVAANVCPLLTAELDTLSTAGLFTGGAADTLNKKITPKVDAVCAKGATVTQVNVQSISGAAVPLLIDLVKASSLSQDDRTTAILAIGTVKGLIDTAFPAATATAAVAAPASASTPLAGSAIQ
ncbi:conserved exported protein of unknown function [Burkholderia multivorans]